ncbi:MAG: succinyl-diaminopimelate desuccinylase [Halothiobacillaceae bacterium]|nr:succinyl-diaminopimelate desuccinylase [Halothiobacillaceae bacterium]HER34556.1 succinyl-diaminopimelate desuccinylase [Halothiobacillaceae bacterium]
MTDRTVDLARDLIRRPSVTPDDQGCQAMIAGRLAPLGFAIESLRFEAVDNLWAIRGQQGPLFVFAGHTDVVPTGEVSRWTYPPFAAVLHDGQLYGRGAADMKGSVAAFTTAVARFLAREPEPAFRLGFLITSDEEGPAQHGTKRVIQWLREKGVSIDWCLVGEPSSRNRLGDEFKIGRRGSLTANLVIEGRQGHVAYPHLADNPVHRAAPFLAELVAIEWDQGNAHFPPTSLQIANLQAGTGANNVIPGELSLQFNLRFNTETSVETIETRVEELLDRHGLAYRLDWQLSGVPFLTRDDGPMVGAVERAVEGVLGSAPTPSTAGGTSDGRFIAPTGAQVIELGPLNATIHQIDEHVAVEDLKTLSVIYERLLDELNAEARGLRG